MSFLFLTLLTGTLGSLEEERKVKGKDVKKCLRWNVLVIQIESVSQMYFPVIFSHKTHPKMTFAFLYLYKVRALKWHCLPMTSMAKFDSGVLVSRRESELLSEEPCHAETSLLPSPGDP